MSGSVATAHAVALVGLQARPVRVEAVTTSGLPTARLIGLPDAAVREAVDRVRTGMQRSGLHWPGSQRLVINLAPADLPKVGTGFDLALACAVAAATDQVTHAAVASIWSVGEVGLDGTLRSVPGTLPAVAGARDHGARRVLVPRAAAAEAALVDGVEVIGVDDLAEVVAVLRGELRREPAVAAASIATPTEGDLREVRGQAVARRAIEPAAPRAARRLRWSRRAPRRPG